MVARWFMSRRARGHAINRGGGVSEGGRSLATRAALDTTTGRGRLVADTRFARHGCLLVLRGGEGSLRDATPTEQAGAHDSLHRGAAHAGRETELWFVENAFLVCLSMRISQQCRGCALSTFRFIHSILTFLPV
jgi:hypothetical protein